jgi:hypothetical protein
MPLHTAQPLHTLGDYLASAFGTPVPGSQTVTSPPLVRVWLKTARTEWRLTRQFARRERVTEPTIGTHRARAVQITAVASRPGSALTVSAAFVPTEPRQSDALPVSSRVRVVR